MRAAGGRRAAQRRSRSALAAGAAAFALAQLGLTALVTLGPPLLSQGDYGGRLARLRQRARAAPAPPLTVVALGSSRMQGAIRAATLDGPLAAAVGRPVVVANFGIAGGGPVAELFTWGRLRADGARPDVALVEVMTPYLSRSFPVNEVAPDRQPTARLRWGELAAVKRFDPSGRPGLRREWVLGRLNACYQHRLTLLSDLLPGLVAPGYADGPAEQAYIDRVALEPPRPDTRSPQQRARAYEGIRQGYAKALGDFRLGGPGCDAMRELVAACRRDGATAALVLMPEAPSFRAWYAPGARDGIRAWVSELAAAHGAAVVDAGEWLAEEEFTDGFHLQPAGAVRFTERLGREAALPILAARAGR
jgi:hypothetical protein